MRVARHGHTGALPAELGRGHPARAAEGGCTQSADGIRCGARRRDAAARQDRMRARVFALRARTAQA